MTRTETLTHPWGLAIVGMVLIVGTIATAAWLEHRDTRRAARRTRAAEMARAATWGPVRYHGTAAHEAQQGRAS